MGRKIRTSIEIDAPVKEVWSVVSDIQSFDKWSKWTKFDNVPDEPVGETTTLLASFDGNDEWKAYDCVFNAIDGNTYLLNWSGSVPCGLFHGNHTIQLKPIDENRTHVTHNEDFSGLLPALNLGMPYAKVERNYGLMNEALKKYIETSRE
eukprot:CAMPEP_0197247620 /NCGR_PEP_ID=MMETSP1429-20130617/30074_1 /TAXON_ID=49237 /ORGANISM="Chaetoceros  sp., Strain UNC1202" /LENGTH=149 /DNA_ID=CAMNT_0042708567 /DNA_START=32 /DNA_END=481 /DNA_ORIENTATION=-